MTVPQSICYSHFVWFLRWPFSHMHLHCNFNRRSQKHIYTHRLSSPTHTHTHTLKHLLVLMTRCSLNVSKHVLFAFEFICALAEWVSKTMPSDNKNTSRRGTSAPWHMQHFYKLRLFFTNGAQFINSLSCSENTVNRRPLYGWTVPFYKYSINVCIMTCNNNFLAHISMLHGVAHNEHFAFSHKNPIGLYCNTANNLYVPSS